MSAETTPLDAKTAYEIATAARPDPRDNFDMVSDVVDLKVPEVLDLLRRLGLFEAGDKTTYTLHTVMDIIKDALVTGAQIERSQPGLLERLENEDYPEELKRAQSSRV